MRIWSKIRAILGRSKFVSGYVERDKKILKRLIFAAEYLRILLRSSAPRAQAVGAIIRLHKG